MIYERVISFSLKALNYNILKYSIMCGRKPAAPLPNLIALLAIEKIFVRKISITILTPPVATTVWLLGPMADQRKVWG